MEIYDLPLLAIWIVILGFLWGIIWLSLNWLKFESNESVFLLSFKIELVWLFLSFTVLIFGEVNRFHTKNNLYLISSVIIGIFSNVLCAAVILYKSANSDYSKGIFQTMEKKPILFFMKTSAITFVFVTVGMITVFGLIYLVTTEIEKRNPKPSVQFGLYDI
jgi:hypothetical protein